MDHCIWISRLEFQIFEPLLCMDVQEILKSLSVQSDTRLSQFYPKQNLFKFLL